METRTKVVAGNWKMNMDYEQGIQLIENLLNAKPIIQDHQKVILGVPFIHLAKAAELTKGYDNLYIAAQDAHEEEAGAYTGNISANMIKSTGASYVILGHSERRQYHHESSDLLYKKVKRAFASNLKVIFCIGEPLEVRENNTHEGYITNQLEKAIFKLDAGDMDNIILAYEPIWAIGTGRTASSQQAQEMHAHIRLELNKHFGEEIANRTSILYGGSCNAQNAKELFAQKDVDGGLIGGASLKAEDFKIIIESI